MTVNKVDYPGKIFFVMFANLAVNNCKTCFRLNKIRQILSNYLRYSATVLCDGGDALREGTS